MPVGQLISQLSAILGGHLRVLPHDGYPRRLRAIGSLHEAEDELQEWPKLRDAIRTAWRAFQQAGTMPDFAAVADAVREPSP